MSCKDLRNGYIEFKWHKYGKTKRVGFTCKSRFCTSCGKVYTDNWIENMLGNLINVRHRHIVFTIPEELRDLKWNPHVHMMVTEDGKRNITEWKHIRHFSYEALRKIWQKVLLDEIMLVSCNSKKMKALKNKLYDEKNKCFLPFF